jgi:threonine/homoserine/homoserine lactone efflux protein
MPFTAENGRIILQGVLLGFSIAAPVGPIALLCIRRTLERGFVSGLVSGLGAATADVIYGGIAAAGLTLIAGFLVGHQFRQCCWCWAFSWVRHSGGWD